ncbi:MAG TPA: branched chain amino acid aminotransferase, partial [Bacillota bacterium]|nr:branched chain amino acid aminotransferase [Bacillota bacterium]
MDESYVFFNGKIVPEKEVSISIRSKVVNYGLACFEGIRAYWDEEGQQLYGFRTTVYIRPLAYKGGEGLNPTLLDDDNRLLIYCQPLGNFSGKQEMRVAFTSWQ